MLFEPANLSEQKAKIVVVGVGGGGGNALNRMIAVINNSVLVPNPKMLSIVLKINTAIKITISHSILFKN